MRVWSKYLSRLVNLARSEYDLAQLEVTNCGEGSRIGRGCQINGAHSISIGRHCVLGEDCWLNVNSGEPLVSRIDVGDFSLIGRRNFISAGRAIRLGAYTLTGPGCHLVCSDHRIDDVTVPYISTGSTIEGSITLGANCWLAASVTVLGQVTIGPGCVVGAGAVVLRDLPPFSLAVGSPARVIKRYNFLKKTWVPVEEWTEAMEAALPREEDYVAALQAKAPNLRIPFLAAGAGVDRPQ